MIPKGQTGNFVLVLLCLKILIPYQYVEERLEFVYCKKKKKNSLSSSTLKLISTFLI